MTFLLFLVSVAVLEFILRRPGETPETSRQPLAHQRVKDRPPDAAPDHTTGLLALGRALEQYGRGQTPSTSGTVSAVSEVSEVPKPQADRV
jgi:hypothetical protein